MYNEQIEYLVWDSNFFKKKIGSIFVKNIDSLKEILKESTISGFQLVYVFCNNDLFVHDSVLGQYNGKLIDIKILYEKEIKILKEQSIFVSEYKNKELTTELELLAYEAGRYSRFKLDKNFEKNDFYRMYKIWIKESLEHQMADNVFVVKEDDIIKGMITLKDNNENGNIGLCAVSPDMQNRGYGKALVTTCENELYHKGIFKLDVPTQAGNINACKFYEKCGFYKKEITNIYHFWL